MIILPRTYATVPKKAKELAISYYQNDKCGRWYKNVLRYFEESNNFQTNKQQTD